MKACVFVLAVLALSIMLVIIPEPAMGQPEVTYIDVVTFSDEEPIDGDTVTISAKILNFRNESRYAQVMFISLGSDVTTVFNMTMSSLDNITLGMVELTIPPVSVGYANVTWVAEYGYQMITVILITEEDTPPVQASIFVEDVNESPLPAVQGLAVIFLMILLVAVLPALLERIRK